MKAHGNRRPRDPNIPGLDFDTRHVLRHIIAPAADDVTQLRVHRLGRGLAGVSGYAYIPLRCRVNIDRMLTLLKNCEAFAKVKQHGSHSKGYKDKGHCHFSPYEIEGTTLVGNVTRARFTCAVTDQWEAPYIDYMPASGAELHVRLMKLNKTRK